MYHYRFFFFLLLLLGFGSLTLQAQDPFIPEAVKLSRQGVKPPTGSSHDEPLTDLIVGQEYAVFEAPPCLEGTYWVGFELSYNVLGHQSTDIDWQAELEVTLMQGTTPLWTNTLSVQSADQTFASRRYHTAPLACQGDYYLKIVRKDLSADAPEAHLKLDFLLTPADQEVFTAGAVTISYNASPTQVTLSHQGSGEVGYDLEWVFYADYENAPADATAAFANKAPVRVHLASTLYRPSFFYPDGQVWLRSRAVGINPAYPDHRIYGTWSYRSAVSVNNIQGDKNWQQQTVFAEQGKRKSIVSYYDGSQRTRQTLTNLSSDERTLVAETRYDYEGRPALNVMPVPVSGSSLAFRTNFNPMSQQNSTVDNHTSALRQKFHYDNTSLPNSILAETSGAGQYYSPNNDLPTVGEVEARLKDYIPDAQGYAYSHTQYTNDPTGRVARQSGVGATFRSDGGRATRYFYGSVASEELVRLFGSQVGDAAHYRKEITVDPNEQVSVSYRDQESRVVATALAGEKPDNLAALASYEALDPDPVTVNLSAKNQATGAASTDGSSTQTHTILNVSPNTEYTFRYQLSALASQVATFGCQECAYDLTITLTGPDGEPVDLSGVTGNQASDGSFGKYDITAASCSSPTAEDISFIVDLADVGDYTLEKKLIPQELDFERATTIVTARTETQTKITALQSTYTVDASECEVCQETCPEAEDVIDETINAVSARECEGILQQIEVEVAANPALGAVTDQPRYCEYELCQKNQASKAFERQLARLVTWSAAAAQGYTTTLETQDPFFTAGLSGEGQLGAMQGRLQNIFVASVEGQTYQGPLTAVTDPTNTAYFINEDGAADPTNGYHLLYYDLMEQHAEGQISTEAYNEKLDQQRWNLYRNFYNTEKRQLALATSDYVACPAAQEEAGQVDNLPITEDDIRQWGQDEGLYDPPSDIELNFSVDNIESACGTTLSEEHRTAVKGHLEAYFNASPSNFFRFILVEDLDNSHLQAADAILANYNCGLAAVAVEDPMRCADERLITLSGSPAASPAPSSAPNAVASPSALSASDATVAAPAAAPGPTNALSSPNEPEPGIEDQRYSAEERRQIAQWEKGQQQALEEIMRAEEARILEKIRADRAQRARSKSSPNN